MTEPATQPATESVSDYPRHPLVDASVEQVTIEFGGSVIVESHRTVRVLETSHPPDFDVVGRSGKVAHRAAWP